ncbi:MAG: sigma-70 family RNA polymerase sigma factor [Bacteroidota bacterium]
MTKAAFTELIKEHKALIYKVCRSYCAVESERADLEQEILYQLWRSRKRFDGRVKVTTWLYKVALNTAIRFYHNQRKRTKQKEDFKKSLIQLKAEENDPRHQQLDQLYQMVAQLKNLDRALILLYLDGNKQSEVAEILGITPSNVATKIGRIKKKFQQQAKLENYES